MEEMRIGLRADQAAKFISRLAWEAACIDVGGDMGVSTK